MPLDARHAVDLHAERPADRVNVDALFDTAFGPGRLAKTAERLRERTPEVEALSIVLLEDGRVVGAARQHRVRVGEAAGTFLGPFAVADDRRGLGYGPRLIAAACEAAQAVGLHFVLLIGPQSYFGALGFSPLPKGAIELGAPVDPARLLVRTFGDAPQPSGRLSR